MAPILDVRDFVVEFSTDSGVLRAVDGVSFDLGEGEVLGLVGESGSGKTVTCRAIICLLPSRRARIVSGSVKLFGEELTTKSEAQTCDTVAMMHAGRIIKRAAKCVLLEHPLHPYTKGLTDSQPGDMTPHQPLPSIPGQPLSLSTLPSGCRFHPRCSYGDAACQVVAAAARCGRRASRQRLHQMTGSGTGSMSALLEVRDLNVHFPVQRKLADILVAAPYRVVRAVNGVTLTLEKGRTLGPVGESGCGKSTQGRAILRLTEATSGDVIFDGRSVLELQGEELLAFRRRAQMVFQDPHALMNPKLAVGQTLAEVLRVHRLCPKREIDARAREPVAHARPDAGPDRPKTGGTKRRSVPACRDRPRACRQPRSDHCR